MNTCEWNGQNIPMTDRCYFSLVARWRQTRARRIVSHSILAENKNGIYSYAEPLITDRSCGPKRTDSLARGQAMGGNSSSPLLSGPPFGFVFCAVCISWCHRPVMRWIVPLISPIELADSPVPHRSSRSPTVPICYPTLVQ